MRLTRHRLVMIAATVYLATLSVGCKRTDLSSGTLSVGDAIAQLPDAKMQRQRICSAAGQNDDAVKDLFCSGKLQATDNLPNLLQSLGLTTSATSAASPAARSEVLLNSMSLDGGNVSPRRPSIVYTSGAANGAGSDPFGASQLGNSFGGPPFNAGQQGNGGSGVFSGGGPVAGDPTTVSVTGDPTALSVGGGALGLTGVVRPLALAGASDTAPSSAPVTDTGVALHFTRGTSAVEMITKDRTHNRLNFYLMTYDIACAAKKCTAKELGSEKLEKGWHNVNLYSDVHLGKTGLDCRNCHATDRDGQRKVLMSDVQNCAFTEKDPQSGAGCSSLRSTTLARNSAPGTGTLAGTGTANGTGTGTGTVTGTGAANGSSGGGVDGGNNGGGNNGGGYNKGNTAAKTPPATRAALLAGFKKQYGQESSYGGAPPAGVAKQIKQTLEPDGFFPSGAFPSDFPPPAQDQLSLAGFPPGASGDDSRVDFALANVTAISERSFDQAKVANPDLPESALYDDTTTPARPAKLLQQACMICHHREQSPDFPASKFNALALDPALGAGGQGSAGAAGIDPKEIDEAVRRLSLAPTDTQVMPPVDYMVLTGNEKAALNEYLQGAARSP